MRGRGKISRDGILIQTKRYFLVQYREIVFEGIFSLLGIYHKIKIKISSMQSIIKHNILEL